MVRYGEIVSKRMDFHGQSLRYWPTPPTSTANVFQRPLSASPPVLSWPFLQPGETHGAKTPANGWKHGSIRASKAMVSAIPTPLHPRKRNMFFLFNVNLSFLGFRTVRHILELLYIRPDNQWPDDKDLRFILNDDLWSSTVPFVRRGAIWSRATSVVHCGSTAWIISHNWTTAQAHIFSEMKHTEICAICDRLPSSSSRWRYTSCSFQFCFGVFKD